MLVSDIEGFTSLSESLPPDDLAQTIGAWYASCEDIINRYGGTVDKFLGDSVLTYWTEVSDATRLAALNAKHRESHLALAEANLDAARQATGASTAASPASSSRRWCERCARPSAPTSISTTSTRIPATSTSAPSYRTARSGCT